jgi:phosphocarrier protein HPr
MTATAEATVLITNDIGLHARPSVKLTKLAKRFSAHVEVALDKNGPWFDAKSIVKVMAARAPQGTLLYLRARGDGAKEAVDALVDLVTRDFDEADEHVRTA